MNTKESFDLKLTWKDAVLYNMIGRGFRFKNTIPIICPSKNLRGKKIGACDLTAITMDGRRLKFVYRENSTLRMAIELDISMQTRSNLSPILDVEPEGVSKELIEKWLTSVNWKNKELERLLNIPNSDLQYHIWWFEMNNENPILMYRVHYLVKLIRDNESEKGLPILDVKNIHKSYTRFRENAENVLDRSTTLFSISKLTKLDYFHLLTIIVENNLERTSIDNPDYYAVPRKSNIKAIESLNNFNLLELIRILKKKYGPDIVKSFLDSEDKKFSLKKDYSTLSHDYTINSVYGKKIGKWVRLENPFKNSVVYRVKNPLASVVLKVSSSGNELRLFGSNILNGKTIHHNGISVTVREKKIRSGRCYKAPLTNDQVKTILMWMD